MGFIENKYKKTYFRIITNSLLRETPSLITEKHHIVPLSLNGKDTKDNIAILTLKEHFICHRLLIKFTQGKNKSKMAKALWLMSSQGKYNTSRKFYFARELYQKYQSEIAKSIWNRPGYKESHKGTKGYKHTDEAKLKSSEAAKRTRNFTGHKHSDESKLKISLAQKGRKRIPLTEETKLKISAALKQNGNMSEASKRGWETRRNKCVD